MREAVVIVASLFAGCGGSSTGYVEAGHHVAYACEINDAAVATYRLNHPGTSVDDRDIREVTGDQIVEVVGQTPDVLDGSPPCQDFSMAGRRDLDGDNAGLYYEFVRLVGELKPRAFCAENVVGIARGQSYGKHFLPITTALTAHGYDVDARVLDASWHGVPQVRKRALIIGIRSDIGVAAARAFPRNRLAQAAIGEALPDVTRLIKRAGKTVTAKNLVYRERKTWVAALPGPTLTTGGPSMFGAAQVEVELRDGTVRPLSVQDGLRLCGFPDWFRFPEKVSDTAKWRMLGNAVPPPMAESWARGLSQALAEQPQI